MRTMYDNTYLPRNPPPTDATAFYIGGEDPARVWSENEISRIATRWRLPIWVNSQPFDARQGANDGIAVADWASRHGQPKGTCIAVDLEAAEDSLYLDAMDTSVVRFGYLLTAYGSASTVLKNSKPSGGYWVAEWDGHANLPAGWNAKQYISDKMLGKPWDLSVLSDSFRLWDTKKVEDEEMPNGLVIGVLGAVTPVAFSPGKYSRITFVDDNGKNGLPPVVIRVAENHDGGDWKVDHITVDSAKGAAVYTFRDSAKAHGLSLTVEGPTAGPVANVSYFVD